MTHHNEQHAVEEKTLFGFWLFILSDVIMFSVLFAAYAVLLPGKAGGIGPGELLSLPRALGETLLLLVSSFTCGLCQCLRPSRVQSLLAITFVLGALFFSSVLGDFMHLLQSGNGWDRSAFLSAYFLLVGTLLAHVAFGLLWMLVLMAQIWKKGMVASTQRRFLCLKMLWPFLNIVWVGVYSWIYLFGAIR
jgi:cytochrome o ubiquinol oxidase subunit 3